MTGPVELSRVSMVRRGQRRAPLRAPDFEVCVVCMRSIIVLSLAVLLPAAASGQQRPAATDALALMGKAFFDDPAVKAFTGDMKDCSVGGAAHIECPLHGVWLALDNEQRIAVVTMRVNSPEGRPLYRGPLPFGLKVSDLRADVLRKLGRPEASSGPVSDYHTWDGFGSDRYPRILVEYYSAVSSRPGTLKSVQVSTTKR